MDNQNAAANADILAGLDRCIRLEERFLPKFPTATPQHSLLQNRIRALYAVRQLFPGRRRPQKKTWNFRVRKSSLSSAR